MTQGQPRFITAPASPGCAPNMRSCSAIERPKLVETIAWAAANGDRSENGDYIYGRKKLREIDRRLGYLAKVMKAAKVVDPARRARATRCGSARRSSSPTRTMHRRTLTIVGDDEADASAGRIGWSAPIARALIGAKVGDERIVRLPAGEKSYEVMGILYPDA